MAKHYQAGMQDAIPIVRTTSERNDLFARLGANLTRVQNLQTGYIERFDGVLGWVGEIPVGRSDRLFDVTERRFGNASESASAATNAVAIKAALSAASDAGGGTVLLPGIFAVPAVTNIANGIRLYANVVLAGYGYGSGVSIDPASYTADGSYNVFSYESDSAAYNFRVNGLKDSVDRTGLAATFNNVFYAANTSVSDVLFDTLWLHDVLGIGGESFGLQAHGTARVTRSTYRNCKGWNFEGTPFHVAGPIETTGAWNAGSGTALDFLVDDCAAWDNDYQGLSIFGAKNVNVRGFKSFRNLNGINVEWSEDVDLYGCVGAFNVIAGLNTFGNVLGLRDHGGAYHENNTANSSSQGEIMVRKGAWWQGSPAPRGTAVSIELHGTTVRPNGSNPHLYVERDTAVNTTYVDPVSGSTLTAGSQVRALKLNVPDAHRWTITHNGSGLAVLGGIDFAASPTLVSPHAGALAGWTATANMAIASSGFSGNRSGGAVRLTGTAQFVNVTTRHVLKPNSTYLIVYRVKPTDATEWRLTHQEAGGSTKPHSVLLPFTTPDLSQWWEGTAVFVTGSIATQLMFILSGAPSGSSILDVDYCYAVEVTGSGAASAVQSHTPAMSADRGNTSVTLTVGANESKQRFDTTLTANRTVTLSTTGAYNGAWFKVIRTGLGAFTMDVGGLKTIPSATAAAVEVTYDGTAWKLSGYELL